MKRELSKDNSLFLCAKNPIFLLKTVILLYIIHKIPIFAVENIVEGFEMLATT